MGNKQKLTVTEKLLLAAHDLEQAGRRPFSAEDLVVAAWRMFPDAFGLAGHQGADGGRAYPDSNRVFAEIMGSKPIRKRGFLVKVGKKRYQLTEAGIERAGLLVGRCGVAETEKIGLGRELQRELKRLLTSKAVDKFSDGRLSEMTFYDACAFWRISPRSKAIELDGRVANFLNILEVARRTIQEKNVTFEHGGDVFCVGDIDMLLDVHKELLRRFPKEVDTIRARIDQRK